MKRTRRLRRLPEDDRDLLRRRAAGETLRALARDYEVAHTTLARYFARPKVAEELKQAARQVRADRRELAARQAEERRLERQVRKRAREQAVQNRENARHAAAAARPRRASDYAAWLDEHDARRPPTRAELHSTNDELAARAVAEGGGVEAVIDATGLRTRTQVLNSIDPAILVKAFANDTAARLTAPPDKSRLRRLDPDHGLLQRRVAGESLRQLADDYAVSHTSLCRYFARPEVDKQLRALARKGAGRRTNDQVAPTKLYTRETPDRPERVSGRQ